MMYRRSSDVPFDRRAVAGQMAPDEVFQAIWYFLCRQQRIIAISLLATVALAAGYLLLVRSIYTAQTSIIIDARNVKTFQSQPMPVETPLDALAVESQVEIIRSDNVARAVIRKLNLGVDSEFTRYGGGFLGNLLYYGYQVFDWSDPSAPIAVDQRVLREFSRSLAVRRLGSTFVIEIRFRSANPIRASQIANAIAESYLAEQLDAKYQSARRAELWLADRVRELREQTISADKSIADFKNMNNIVDVNGRSTSEQQITELNTQLLSAKTQTTDARARLDRIEQIVGSDVREATVSDTLRSDVVSKLRSQYLDIANREADLAAKYGNRHQAVVNLQNQMREISRSIKAELSRLAETYKSDLEIAKQRETEVQMALTEAVAKSQVTRQSQSQLKELESASQTYRSLYESILQRNAEAIQQQSNPVTEARVISLASPPFKRSSPSTILAAFVGVFSGLLLGIGLGLMRDLADRSIRTRSQAKKLLDMECLSLLPFVQSESIASGYQTGRSDSKIIRRNENAAWTVLDDPMSFYAEEIRTIKMAIDASKGQESARIVGFLSALPGEGKSSVAASLAFLTAQSGAKVLLIDGDLRQTSLSRIFCPGAEHGLLQAASRSMKLNSVIWTHPATGLKILPAEQTDLAANASEILGSDFMNSFFESIRDDFKYIFVDLPPLLASADAQAAMRYVQSCIIVAEWGYTQIDDLKNALGMSRTLKHNTLGLVLNKVDELKLVYYGEQLRHSSLPYHDASLSD